jgi:uncharacterized protein (DUF697 family)
VKFPKIEWAVYRDRLLAELFDEVDPDSESQPEQAVATSSGPNLPTTADRAERDRAIDKVLVSRARAAAGLGALPLVDLVAVTALQARMLRDIAHLHGIRWTPDLARDLLGRLGPGIAGAMVGQTLGRSALKFIPLVGQTAGAAWSARSARASTYALGRAADWYLNRLASGHPIESGSLRRIHREAVEAARDGFAVQGDDPQ